MAKVNTPGQARARVRVIQSDPEFRLLVLRFIQSHSSIYELVEDLTDMPHIAQGYDLLITELESLPHLKSGSRGAVGNVPVEHADEKRRPATIFLTNEPATLKIARSLANTNTLAYIHRTSILFDSHTQALLQIALGQFEEAWQLERRQRVSTTETATVVLDRLSEKLISSNDQAQRLFGFDQASVGGDPWWKFLGRYQKADHPFSYAIDAGFKLALPPTPIERFDGREVVVSGLAAPKLDVASEVVTLSLLELCADQLDSITGQIGEHDTVAVLGVDQIEYGPNWTADDNSAFMLDLRAGLLEILRAHDVVSLPQGHCISLILVHLGIEESMDVCNAVLSHLRSVPPLYGAGVAAARFSVGLAGKAPQNTALQCVAAANNALTLAQQKVSSQRIRLSSNWDNIQLGSSNYVGDGAFTLNSYGAQSAALLAQLALLRPRWKNTGNFQESILELLLKPAGIRTVAVFQRRHASAYGFLMGGQSTDGGMRLINEQEVVDFKVFANGRPKLQFEPGKYAVPLGDDSLLQPLVYRRVLLGFLAVEFEPGGRLSKTRSIFDPTCLHFLASLLPGLKDSPDAPPTPGAVKGVALPPPSSAIEGYVVDNMEGAVDQATFLAKVDMPVAIIGPRGTGKMYIAKIVHQESGGAEGMIQQIDCREFRNRDEANAHISKVLQRSEGKTLVFKSPHLLAPDAQVKLARQLSTRTLADVRPPRYLPAAKYIALFPDELDKLVANSGLASKLASVFAGFPIHVPPVKDRKQAVLRWAYKILGQESAAHEIPVKGFTPDAEQAMLSHEWLGNISEMRQSIVAALERTDKDWITPVDLGIFKGISPQGAAPSQDQDAFLTVLQAAQSDEGKYSPTTLEDLDGALAEAVNALAGGHTPTPLGEWLDDELILAVNDRYQRDLRLSAEFLHTKPRNISRRMPKILSRQEQRTESALWKTPRRCVREWVRETPIPPESPLLILQNILLGHVVNQCAEESVATRAKIMGVSVPTYQKRLQQL